MLEGLEISEVNFQNLTEDNEKFRIDSEFYQKEYIEAYKHIKSKRHIQFKSIIGILTDFSANGSYASIANNFELLSEKDYAYMVRSTDLEKSDFVNDVKYITKHSYEFLSKSKIFGGEILINKIGSPGRVYVMPKLNCPVSLGMNLFMIRLLPHTEFKEKYIWAFFNSVLGQRVIRRKINGTVPLTIDKEAVRSLYIPYLIEKFQIEIEVLINRAEDNLKQAKIYYVEAESRLLSELNLTNLGMNKELVSVKSFSKSFLTSGRLDAEYYQSKYDDLFSHLNKFECKSLGQIVSIQKSIEPGSDAYQEEGIPFIRVSNLNKFGLSNTDIHLSREEYKDFEPKPKKDTILLSKDGSVGIAYKVEQDLDVITSGAILHLTITDKEFLPDYVTLALNSMIVKLQAERDAGGSIIQHWKPSEIEQVIIPKLPMSIQEEIASKIQESFALKAQSERLLDLAKRAVEIAIEEGEKKAEEWVESMLKI